MNSRRSLLPFVVHLAALAKRPRAACGLALLLTLFTNPLPVGAQSFESARLSGPNFVQVGQAIDYSLTVATGTTHPAPNATITDHLPASTPYVTGSLTCSGGTGTTCAYIPGAHVIEWSGALATSDSVTISFAVDTTAVTGGEYVVNQAYAEQPTFPSETTTWLTSAIEPGNEPAIEAPFNLVDPDGSTWSRAPAPITWSWSRGLFLTVWPADDMSGGAGIGVRTIALDGTRGTVADVTSVTNDRTLALSCSTTSDRCLVAYSRSVATGDADIWARFVDGGGSPVGAEFPVYQGTGIQVSPSVVYNSNLDEFLVVWENMFADGRWDIQAQRIRAGDGVFESWSIIATGAGEKRHYCGVDHNPDRDQYLFVYAFGSTGNEGRAKIGPGNLAGVSIGSELTIWSTPDTCSDVSVVAGEDEFLVVWMQAPTAIGDSSIRGRRIGGDGTLHGPGDGFFIGGFATQGWLLDPQAGFAGEHGYLVTWGHDDPLSPTTEDIHGRYVERVADGPAYSEFPVITTVDWDFANTFACAPTGRCLLANAAPNNVIARFLTGWRIFSDGFESGDLGRWPTAIP